MKRRCRKQMKGYRRERGRGFNGFNVRTRRERKGKTLLRKIRQRKQEPCH